MSGFGGWLESAAHHTDDFVHTAGRLSGDLVEGDAHYTAEALNDVGLHSAAKATTDFADRYSDRMGNQIAEDELGDTDDATRIVHGDPGAINEAAHHLRRFGSAFQETAKGLRGLDTGHWRGQAADAFHAEFHTHPARWSTASQAMEDAATALESYAKTVNWAQGQAQHAIDAYARGRTASKEARAAYNTKVDAYNAHLAGHQAGRGPAPVSPGTFHDPGAAQIAGAQDTLLYARDQRDLEGYNLAKALGRARRLAPALPSFSQRLADQAEDLTTEQELSGAHAVAGFAKAAGDLNKFARGLDPRDPYNIAHPALYLDHLSQTAAGLLHAGDHPVDFVKATVGTGWSSDPGEASGRLLANAAAALLTDGASSGDSVAADAAENTAVSDSVSGGADGFADQVAPPQQPVAPPQQPVTPPPPDYPPHVPEPAVPHEAPVHNETPAADQSGHVHEWSRDQVSRTETGDPVDVASGRVRIAQTDVALPAALPLAFPRTHETGYRIGQWLGPSWACPFDERVEPAPDGLVLVRADGRVLTYPEPAGDESVPPAGGSRLWLRRTEDGYTAEDQDTGRCWEYTRAGGTTARLTAAADRQGHWISYTYDEAGAPATILHEAGQRLLVRTAAGRITGLLLAGAGPDGTDLALVRYLYTGGHLTGVANSSGRPLRFAYDAAGRVTRWTDRNDQVYDYVYDDDGRCVAQGGADGVMRYTFAYGDPDPDTGLTPVDVGNSHGHRTRYLVDAAFRIVSETDPLGAVTHSEWSDDGRLLSRTDPTGRTIRFRYDADGRRTAAVRPDGLETRTGYDDRGRPVTVTMPDGATWTRRYTPDGNPLSLTDPAGATTAYGHDAAGHPATVTDALGATTALRYDEAGRLTAVTDPLGATTTRTRDAFGRIASVTGPDGRTTRTTWTPEGLPAARVHPDGSRERWEHDAEGNLLEHHDTAGRVSRYTYTHFNRRASQTAPDGTRHTFAYDTELRLTEVTNPQGRRWSYRYDAAGRLTSETDFNGRTVSYGHDAAGRLTSRRNADGQVVRHTYDVLGRPATKDVDGIVTVYEHDCAGRLVAATAPGVRLGYRRDTLGRVIDETVNDRTLHHTYDILGRRTSRRTPSGAVSARRYDAAGRCVGLTADGRDVTWDYDAAGREIRRTVGALTFTQDWDTGDRLLAQRLAGPAGPVHRRAYTYQDDGRLTGVDDSLTGRLAYDLDEADRVTAVHGPQWTETYAYDEIGNVTDAAWPGALRGREAAGERRYTGTLLQRSGAVRYTYDPQGRVVRRTATRLSRTPEVWEYTWDGEDRLTGIRTPDGTRWRYLYDPLGRRTAKERLTAEGDTAERTDFTWDGLTLVEQTTRTGDTSPAVSLTWEYDGLRPLCQAERITAPGDAEIDRRFFAIVTDLLGTPSELVDESGDITWRTRRTLWGDTSWAAGSTAYTPLRFPGQYFDPETRLHYNVHRYYDPLTARYATPDPLGLAPAPNPHAYVHNPTTWSDPTGLAPNQARPAGTAPSFVIDSHGGVQDVRSLGRPDNELVLSGHGGIHIDDVGDHTTVPENTWLAMYSHHGVEINDALGNSIERGDAGTVPVEIYGPGEKLTNYVLLPGNAGEVPLTILGEPRTVTVNEFTRLSEILHPNMGVVHWAACRKVGVE